MFDPGRMKVLVDNMKLSADNFVVAAGMFSNGLIECRVYTRSLRSVSVAYNELAAYLEEHADEVDSLNQEG